MDGWIDLLLAACTPIKQGNAQQQAAFDTQRMGYWLRWVSKKCRHEYIYDLIYTTMLDWRLARSFSDIV